MLIYLCNLQQNVNQVKLFFEKINEVDEIRDERTDLINEMTPLGSGRNVGEHILWELDQNGVLVN